MLGLVAAVCCWFVFTAWLPADVQRYADYAAARPCADGGTHMDEERAECLASVPFAVQSTVIQNGKSPNYQATVFDGSITPRVVSFGDPGPLLSRLRSGDVVTVTIWRGEIVVLEKGGVRQSTSDAPRDEAQVTAALGTFAGLMAALGLAVGLGVGPPEHRRSRFSVWHAAAKPLALMAMLICAAAATVTLLLGVPWWVVPATAAPVTVAGALAVARYR
ncbi:hypothetical protein ACFXDJ_27160 [Streptomyces sp. NPDC059443]|uniref:hypothetical protein n=1 Tax=unclassified Streptomyces TaxID=2593676 RepID=UPI0036C21C67